SALPRAVAVIRKWQRDALAPDSPARPVQVPSGMWVEGLIMAIAAAERLVTAAAEHYNAGRAGAADALCGDILNGHPDYLPALHLAAVIAFSAGRMSEGSALLGRVFARDPDHVPAYITLGD